MIRKKVCMLGGFAVGKTSLVARFVRGIFSDKYLTTIGVKIDRKLVETSSGSAQLLLWDLAGDDNYEKLRLSHLKGMSGFLLVVDGTRAQTLVTALKILDKVEANVSALPFVLILNKADKMEEWSIDETLLKNLKARGVPILKTSALSGDGVEDAFTTLTVAMLNG